MVEADPVLSFGMLSALLIFGKLLRMAVPLLEALFLPSSVIAGLFGLVVMTVLEIYVDADTMVEIRTKWIAGWDQLAGFLINIVFSALFLGTSIPRPKTVWQKSGPQLMYGMVVAFGQWVVGLVVTGLILIPIWDVQPVFATLLPIGFAGGHGTAAGLGPTLIGMGFEEGLALGLLCATIGLVLSIVMGIAWINIAVHRGWVARRKAMETCQNAIISIRGVYPADNRPLAGVQTVKADSIDTLALHLAFIGLAMGIGYAIKAFLVYLECLNDTTKDIGFFAGFPLFPLCMGGGIGIQLILQRVNKDNRILDARIMERISGTSLDFLVTAAVASVKVMSAGQQVLPLVVLSFAGVVWHCLCLGIFVYYLVPNYWFERGICEFGMSMGVIASGLVLLRTCDPESSTPVPADFAYKQLLHSPFMGGGLWTVVGVQLTYLTGIWNTCCVSAALTLMWLILWWFCLRPQYPETNRQEEMRTGLLNSPDPPAKRNSFYSSVFK